jgi:multidrug efflux system membrane fusion protein
VTPVYVSFSVPEQSLGDIRQHMAAGKVGVQALSVETAAVTAMGVLDFIDNSVDATTGTIRLKATFPNPDKRLWPGQFVNVMLRLSMERGALVVPSAAVQSSQNGRYVWVIKPDSTAEMRIVQVSRTQGTMAVLANGIQAGESVVTEGQLRLRPGAKVEILKSAQKTVASAS